jgi:flagellin-specific chaperone FliS
MAELEFQELRESLSTAGQTALEQQLLWLYDHCLRKLRFGQLHEGMSLIRSLLERKEGEAA